MDLSNITDKNIIFQKIESFIGEKGFNIAAKASPQGYGEDFWLSTKVKHHFL